MAKPSTRADKRAASERSRARVIFLGALILSAAILAAWFPVGALLNQRSALAAANSQLHQLRTQDSALAQERKNLSSSSEISRLAREQYQLVSPGQEAYQVLPPSGASSGLTPYAGDPGAQGPVAPSASVELPPGMTTTTVPGHAKAPATSSSGIISRMLHALEFWR
jgi:cell division protein FtsB